MKYAVIDTETTGLFDFRKPADADGQPRLASLAIVELNEDLSVSAEREFLARPDGWEMGEEAAAINGLTMERLASEGVPIVDILRHYTTLVESGLIIAAFNAQFDLKVLRGELRRANMDDMFTRTPNVCVMRSLTETTCLPKATGRGYKFPKLGEACAHFGIEQPAAHSAIGDARSAVLLLKECVRLGVLAVPEVHYAKTEPTKPSEKKEPEAAPAKSHVKGDRVTEGGVELEHNGVQFVPVFNARNYPNRFERDGLTPKAR